MTKLTDIIKKVKALFEKEQYKEIISLLSNVLLDKSNDADLYAWRAWTHSRLAETEKAFKYAEKAIATDPDNSFGYRQRAGALLSRGEYDKAIADFDNAIELKKDDEIAYSGRGNAWSYKNEYDKAIADFDIAIELKKDYSFAYYLRGNAWNNKSDYDKAILDFNKAIELKKDYAQAYFNRGNTFNSKREYDKAILDFNKAIELKKDDDQAYFNRGNAWNNKEEYDKAILDFNKAIELKKDSSYAYNNRGISWNYKKEYDKAIADFSKSIELNKDNSQAYNNRGYAFTDKGEYEKAISDFDKAIELKEDDANHFRNRGQAFYLKGDFQKALNDYQTAISKDESFKFLEYNIKLAKEELEERKILTASKAQPNQKDEKLKIEKEIDKAINIIRVAAKSEVKTVVHYTKLFVADIYVKNVGTKMHYSNAIYMNDPMEGKVFFEYLNDNAIKEAYENGEKRTETSVYLGSFLPAEENDGEISHEDELVMWRTYGKDENGKEAAGCSVVLSSDFFNVATPNKDQLSAKENSEEELLNVVYVKRQKTKKEITNDSKGEIDNAINGLKKQLRKFIKLRNNYKKTDDFYKDIENTVFKKLSTISYLFKSADYDFEHEVRVITYMPRNSDSIKYIINTEPNAPQKRFYIESYNDILPYVKKIYLGPKVLHYQQWSLYFDYEIRQRSKELEGMFTPYQIKPSDIEIMKSECKFQ